MLLKFNFKLFSLLLLSMLCLLLNVHAQNDPSRELNRFTKIVLAQKLQEPMQFQVLKNGKVLYAERKGRLKVYNPATKQLSVIAEIPVSTEYVSKSGERSEGEDGLQGVILDPNFEKNHWIYLYYSAKGNESVNSLVRYTWTGGQLNLASAKVLLKVPVQREECCHVGGGMLFDQDNNLLLSTGDNTFSRSSDGFAPIDERKGESPRDAQKSSSNTNDLRGKILRIHPEADGTYTIPEGNLFPKGTPKTRPEIYTMGNRNPWRMSLDSKTNWLYWGEVGPDGSNASDLRGPVSYDEFNLAKKAGNYGWPYFIGNEAYRYYDFATKKSGDWYDPFRPVNNSPNNTGLTVLPPTQPSLIWYPYTSSEKFPLMGSGGRSAVGGPIFRQTDFSRTGKVFPAYYEGKWFITDWVRGWILIVTMDDEGNYKSMERFMPDLTLRGPIDMKFGPDGSLYVLEYGNGYFKDNPEAQLIKIEYNSGNRKPIVQATADKTAGALPLVIKLSSKGTKDYDGDSLKYEWRITKNNVLNSVHRGANPELRLTAPGIYKATLTVTDPGGARNSKTVEISAGNAPPVVQFNFTKGNSSFYFPGNTINYAVNVTDKEDGSLADKRILPAQVSVAINYLSEGYDMTTIAQSQKTFDATAQFAAGKAIIKKSTCNSCHDLTAKSLGPSFTQVALKYKTDKNAKPRLVKKIINGGSGVWGDAMMPGHSTLSNNDANAIVSYVLSLSNKQAAPKTLPVKGSYTTNVPADQTNKGSFIFRAAYKDRGAKFAAAQFTEHMVLLRYPSLLVNDADRTNGFGFNEDRSIATVQSKGAYLQFNNIDLTDIEKIEIVGDRTAPDHVEIRIGAADGKIISQANGIRDKRNVVEIIPVKGRFDVYLVFKETALDVRTINVKNR
ncbi:c-type cytochrome [Pedobacter hiemivivus]|uniref:C-type cytochrome n=1 Tax=Pedobacter hiemivivus TaxID=2530454 RepID=A0A4U1G703_9SPHI|nr:PQQ-dependent sugar dehydrogenase [Pedobacter hiemivivus]TKC59204.1 c-type cytochrome [Pedobacter hiemivivus]